MENKHLKPLGPFLRVNTLELTVFAAVSRFKNRHNTAATVHDVMALMDEPPGYTSVKTVLDRLTDKGFLARRKSLEGPNEKKRTFYYTPLYQMKTVLAQMQAAIDEIVSTVLDDVTKGI